MHCLSFYSHLHVTIKRPSKANCFADWFFDLSDLNLIEFRPWQVLKSRETVDRETRGKMHNSDKCGVEVMGPHQSEDGHHTFPPH